VCGKIVLVGHGLLVRNNINKGSFDQSPKTHNFIAPYGISLDRLFTYMIRKEATKESETTIKSAIKSVEYCCVGSAGQCI
jgi:hypothetical protein